ncbi:MAG: YedE family putative selenium transporter [Eubacteriales bacterium]|nr:YedE family putative selenium transporter [Eubacteriales bacterium]
MSAYFPILIAGAVTGLLAVLLTVNGNPANMGFCIACFIRDIAGGLGLHRAPVVQYIRPEIPGLVLGAFLMSLFRREFRAQSGSAPLTRFLLGVFVMIGSLVFLGCPLRMVLRLAGGDLNALVGLAGFACGVGVGAVFLNKGFSLRRAYSQPRSEGYIPAAVALGLLALLVSAPAFIFFSESGPGSLHAPIILALAAGLAVGMLAQYSRLCMMGGIRDLFLFRDPCLISGFCLIFLAALIGNAVNGSLHFSFADQPVAHTESLWNFLGMLLVGLGSVFLGGCPLRQLILAGSGSGDAGLAVLGLAAGAAFCHNFGLASSASGTTPAGRAAVILGLAFCLVVGLLNLRKK